MYNRPSLGPIFMASDHIIQSNSNSTGFSAAFLSQQSYVELLRTADSFFDLHMTTRNRILPCQVNSYMLIARTPPRAYRYLWKGTGRKVSLSIDRLLYNSNYGILVGLVQLKTNFTCNNIPHIVLAKREGVNNSLVSRVIENYAKTELPSQIETLYSPFKVHGKIGVMIGSIEEDSIATIIGDTGTGTGTSTGTSTYVAPPEVMFSVEQSPPFPLPSHELPQSSTILSFDDFKTHAHVHYAQEDDQMKITVKGGDVATGEKWQGEMVMKGPRGGKFIIKDGKKKYVPVIKEDGDDVYNVNILQD